MGVPHVGQGGRDVGWRGRGTGASGSDKSNCGALDSSYSLDSALIQGRRAWMRPICWVVKPGLSRQYSDKKGRKKTAPALTVKYHSLGTILRLNLEGRPSASSRRRWCRL